ncbi:hypothetical protein SUGI_0299360 [Cryptomeria japonica]|nr:hypothetical protein SUGI_0299360 [Cryptomeria japonica]
MGSVGLYTRAWAVGFDPPLEAIKRARRWIKMVKLLQELWLEESFRLIGDSIGSYIKCFNLTWDGRKSSYARICIFLDISAPLQHAVRLSLVLGDWLQEVKTAVKKVAMVIESGDMQGRDTKDTIDEHGKFIHAGSMDVAQLTEDHPRGKLMGGY